MHKGLGTQNEKGTGLGLMLTREFIEKNGGKIWVTSTLGQGTCFTFSLPLTSPDRKRSK
jgi:signal transduction histidine kinase